MIIIYNTNILEQIKYFFLIYKLSVCIHIFMSLQNGTCWWVSRCFVAGSVFRRVRCLYAGEDCRAGNSSSGREGHQARGETPPPLPWRVRLARVKRISLLVTDKWNWHTIVYTHTRTNTQIHIIYTHNTHTHTCAYKHAKTLKLDYFSFPVPKSTSVRLLYTYLYSVFGSDMNII